MLSMTPPAITYIKERDSAIYLELPPMINSCIHVQEAPLVKIGMPTVTDNHQTLEIDGVTIYLPHDFPEIDLTIDLTNYIFFKKLCVEGWNLV